MIQKWIKISSHEKIITHEDYKMGLAFRVIYSQGSGPTFLLVYGNSDSFDKYKARFLDIIELSNDQMKAEMAILMPTRQAKCPLCGNTYAEKGFDISTKNQIITDLAKNRTMVLEKYGTVKELL